jgi:feruloyl esterase
LKIRTQLRSVSARLLAAAGLAALAACGGGNEASGPDSALKVAGGIPANARGDCSVKMAENAVKHDKQASVLLVKSFVRGEPLLLTGSPTANTPSAANDLCLVKLLVGPGNPGPTGAPSTSPGIGIEVWLPRPENWIGRLHNLGGGGWAGGRQADTSAIASTQAAGVAGSEGAISGTTDTGHAITGTGSFAMNPDGSINTALWTDFSVRSLHELAVKAKNLSAAYYGKRPTYSYWEGGSTGGRQGLKIAQEHPGDYDGLIVNYPANNWTKFITAELYPQIVYQRDLGGTPLTSAQANALGNAAIAACDVVGGQHLGYILDPSTCTYDPTKDAAMLCSGEQGNGVVGTNSTPACVNLAQATAANKIWYGQTTDGSVPDPAADTGWSVAPTGKQRWYGLARGTTFSGLAGANPFTIATDMLALEMQDPFLATSSFINGRGNGADGWRNYSYAQLSNALDRGIQLQPEFAYINTDDPDLSAFARRGGRMITWHGLADQLIPAGGTINYYHRVAERKGSLAAVQDFWKLYLVPAAGHGSPNGTTNPTANPPAWAPGQQYALLTAWVEQGAAPDQITLQTNSAPVKSRPICVYPKKATFIGGDPNVAASYACS